MKFNQKKIMIIVNHEVVIYNFRKELVEKLLNEQCEVVILSPNGPLIDKLKKMGCIHVESDVDRHSKNPVKDIKLLWMYLKTMKEVKPDVVLTYTIKPNIYGGIASGLLNIPFIANITGLGTALENKSILQKITFSLYSIAFSKVQRVYFQNDENLDFFLKRGFEKNRTKLLPGSGVNLTHFKMLDFPQNNTIEFVFISRIMKEKGIDLYLESASYIKKKYPNTIFHVCGFCEDDYEDTLNDYVRNGIIKYHGMVQDIREILKQVHCTVHPTYYPEGMSNALLESAACGRPLISTNRSGCREIIDHGKNGYLIEPQDKKALTEAIEAFINLPESDKKEMGRQSRLKVEIKFDRNIVVNEYMQEIYS